MDATAGELILRRRGWLSERPAAFRRTILEHVVWQRYEASQSVFVGGDPAGGIYGIADGSIGATGAFGPADSPMAHIWHPGDWFGERSILSDEPRRMSTFAVTDALLAHMPRAVLRRLLSDHPEWWQHIGQLAVFTIDIIANGFIDLMIRDPYQRCAAILLRLCDCRQTDAPADAPREIVMSQQEVAAMANLSRDTANQVLGRLAQQRLIERRYRSIVVIEAEALREIANGEQGMPLSLQVKS